MKVRVYTDKKYLPFNEYHTYLLYPFWGYEDGPYGIGKKHEGAFDEYIKEGKNFYEIVNSPKDCDIILYPGNFKLTEKFKKLHNISKQFNKKLITFYESDDNEAINLSNTIIFRTGGYKNSSINNIYGMPIRSTNYYKDKIFFTKYYNKPTIGYSGYVNYLNIIDFFIYNTKKIIKKVLGYEDEFRWDLRGKIVRKLLKNKNINFIFNRKKHFGGKAQKKDPHYNWYNFMDNIANCTYNLAIRGKGNRSIRFYEILNAGRIPLFLDTNCILPFDDKINRDKLLIRVKINQINEIDKILIKYHTNKTKTGIEKQQEAIRKIYIDYISPKGFFDKIRMYF